MTTPDQQPQQEAAPDFNTGIDNLYLQLQGSLAGIQSAIRAIENFKLLVKQHHDLKARMEDQLKKQSPVGVRPQIPLDFADALINFFYALQAEDIDSSYAVAVDATAFGLAHLVLTPHDRINQLQSAIYNKTHQLSNDVKAKFATIYSLVKTGSFESMMKDLLSPESTIDADTREYLVSGDPEHVTMALLYLASGGEKQWKPQIATATPSVLEQEVQDTLQGLRERITANPVDTGSLAEMVEAVSKISVSAGSTVTSPHGTVIDLRKHPLLTLVEVDKAAEPAPIEVSSSESIAFSHELSRKNFSGEITTVASGKLRPGIFNLMHYQNDAMAADLVTLSGYPTAFYSDGPTGNHQFLLQLPGAKAAVIFRLNKELDQELIWCPLVGGVGKMALSEFANSVRRPDQYFHVLTQTIVEELSKLQ